MAGLKDIYYNLEDKYYDVLDWLDARKVPVYKLVDVIENQGLPSFPFVGGGLIVILLVLLVFLGSMFGQATLAIAVQDAEGNPITSANVNITPEGGAAITKTTDDDGTLSIKLPLDTRVTVTVSKEGYKDRISTFTVDSENYSKTITLEEEITELTREIRLLANASGELLGEYVSVQFTCSGAAYSKKEFTDTGIITLTDVPSDCGRLNIHPTNGYSSDVASFNAENSEPYSAILTSGEEGSGTVIVYVVDESGVAVTGVQATLTATGGSVIGSKEVLGSGSVQFENVPAGRYFVVVSDSLGDYGEMQSTGKDVFEGATTSFNITLQQAAVGKVRLRVLDSQTMLPVSGASVTLSKQGTTLSPKSTDKDGKVEFPVGENVNYEILVDHSEFLLEQRSNIKPTTEHQDILLTRSTNQNSQSLSVTILDEKALPVENARVRVKKASDGAGVSEELVTGTNGKVVFQRLEVGEYYAYVYKPGHGEANSETIKIEAREAKEATVTLPIGDAYVSVMVYDERMQPVPGAALKVIDTFTGDVLKEGITESTGEKLIEIRADKRVYVEVSAPGQVLYITKPVQMVKDTTKNIEVITPGAVSELDIEYLGLYADGQEATESLNPGQRYKAKLLLKVPENTTFNEAGVHFRTGRNDAGAVERDYIYINDIVAATEEIVRGASYTPEMGYAQDAQKLTTGKAKWANVVIDKPKGAVYEVEADVAVSESAPTGARLEVHYRAWGRAGGYVRAPTDVVLGSAETSANRQALYARTKDRIYSAGAGLLCGENFCETYSIEDKATGIDTIVIEEYPAKTSGSYKLRFYLTSTSPTEFAASELQISDVSSSIVLGEYEATTVQGQKLNGIATGSELVLDVGNIAKDDSVQGVVDFTTKNEGSVELVVAIVTKATKEKVSEKRIRVNIEAADQMSLDIVPKIIVPYVNNNLLIKVSAADTENEISNANVEVIKDDEVIGSGQTDSEGVFAYTLQSPGAGSSIKIRAEKMGYAPVERSIAITENILVVNPPEIVQNLNAAENEENLDKVVLANLTEMPLRITDVSARGDFEEYIEVNFMENYEGETIGIGQDFNIDVITRLNEKGRLVDEVKALDGSLTIEVSNSVQGKKWVSVVPLRLRIVFGDSVDELDCLRISPAEWVVSTETEVRTLNATIINACKVDGEAIALRNLEAKVDTGGANPLGLFEVSADLPGGERVALSEEFKDIATLLPSSAEASVAVSFRPDDISSAEGAPKLVFRAVNPTATGEEIIGTAMDTEVHIDKLTECLEFTGAQNLIIDSCPYNTGFGNFGNQFSNFDPNYMQYNNTQGRAYPNQWTGGARSNSFGLGLGNMQGNWQPGRTPNPFLYQRYAEDEEEGEEVAYFAAADYYVPKMQPNTSMLPFYAGDYMNPGANNQWRCNTAEFGIRNNCGSPVEVSIESDPGVVVEESTVTIAPGKEEKVGVEAAYMVGNYRVGVNAKIKGSRENSVKVRDILVTIRNQYTETYRDCISVSPARSLNFNNFLQEPVIMKVTNTCFAQGIRLDESPQTIEFATQGLAQPTQPTASGVRDMITNWGLVDVEYREDGIGNVSQILTFEVVKSQAYRENVPEFPTTGPAEMQVGMLRYYLASGNYAVNARTTMVVYFRDMFGQRKSAIFNYIIEDWWSALQYLPECYGNPSLDASDCINKSAFDLCNIMGNLDADDFVGNLFVYDAEKRTDKGFFNLASKNGCGKDGCGAGDRITSVNYSKLERKLEDAGLDVTITHSKRNIVMKLRANKNFDRTEGVTFSSDMTVTVQRAMTASKAASKSTVTVPVQICVDGDIVKADEEGRTKKDEEGRPVPAKGCTSHTACEGDVCINDQCRPGTAQPELAAAATGCAGGETGEEAYKKFGFDRLPFTWEWDGITKDTCDAYENSFSDNGVVQPNEDYKFCDAVQFLIALNKKAEILKDFAGALELTPTEKFPETREELAEKGIECTGIRDDVLHDELCFYKDGEGKFVSAKLENVTGVQNEDIKEIREYNTNKLNDWVQVVTSWMPNNILNKLSAEGNVEDGRDIVGLIKADPVSNFKDRFEALGLEQHTVGGETYWVWTFEEYNKFHEDVVAAMQSNQVYAQTDNVEAGKCNPVGSNDSTSCGITKIDDDSANTNNAPVNVDVQLLKTIYVDGEITFVPGCRKGSTRDECWKAALNDGEPIAALGEKLGEHNYGSLLEFWEDIVNPEVYLVRDGYSKDLKDDFVKEFRREATEIENMGLPDAGKLQAKTSGRYKALLNYTEGEEDAYTYNLGLKGNGRYDTLGEIDAYNERFKLISNSEYARNILLSIPFDGTFGTFTRSGYGTTLTFKNRVGSKRVYLNDGQQMEKYSTTTSKNAIEKMNLDYEDGFDSGMSNSTIVDITRENNVFQFLYRPYDAIPIKLEVEKTGGDMFYSVIKGNTKVSVPNDVTRLLTWSPAGQDLLQATTGKCSGITENHFGLDDLETGVQQTVAYVPTGTAYSLKFFKCGTEFEKGYAVDPFFNSSTSKKYDLINNQTMQLNSSENNKRETIYNLRNLTEDMVKNEYVCVYAGTERSPALQLTWNEERLYKHLDE